MTKISGPMFAARLEGKINNIDKVLYCFGDYHFNVNIQTECSDLRAVHIKQHLLNIFSASENKIDFFLENYPDVYKSNDHTVNYTTKYLIDLRRMFEKIFNFDFKKNKIIESELFPNIRLHYIDIRSYLSGQKGSARLNVNNNIHKYINMLKKDKISIKDLHNLKNMFSILVNNVHQIYDTYLNSKISIKKNIIRENNQNRKNNIIEDANEVSNYLFNKLKHVYTNENVKNKINDFLQIHLKKYINDLNNNSTKIKKIFLFYENFFNKPTSKKINYKGEYQFLYILLPHIKRDFFYELDNILHLIDKTIKNFFAMIMDMYFLRRFLDKNYIKTGIVYTGYGHTANYIKYLIRDFNFNITHITLNVSRQLNLKKSEYIKYLNKKIKSIDNEDINKYILPNSLLQCIDLSDFPNNFN